MKTYTLKRLGVLALTFTVILTPILSATPVLAETLPYNPANTTVDTVTTEDTMDRNAGEIINNNGLVHTNENTGNIKNNGPVDGDGSNGHIGTNYGIVEKNNGIIDDNGEPMNYSERQGNIIINAENGTVTRNDPNSVVCINQGIVGTGDSDMYGDYANNGVVRVNTPTGTIVNNDEYNSDLTRGGIVEANFGGTVTGTGTIEANFGDGNVSEGNTILHQFWQLAINGLEKLGLVSGSQYTNKDNDGDYFLVEANEYGIDEALYVQQDTAQNQYMLDLKSSDNDKIVKGFKTVEGSGQYIVPTSDNGAYCISTIPNSTAGSIGWFRINSDGQVHIYNVKNELKLEVILEALKKADIPVENVMVETKAESSAPTHEPTATEDFAIVSCFDKDNNLIGFNIKPVTLNSVQAASILSTMQSMSANHNTDINNSLILGTYDVTSPKSILLTLNLKKYHLQPTDIVYGIMIDKLSGISTYVRATVNADGTITTDIPQNNSLMTLIRL